MPVRDFSPGYLGEAIDSVLAQTCPAWRLLFIAEPGEAECFCARRVADLHDARISVVANEGRQLAGSLNIGMRRARSSYVAILFADDLWAPEAVAVLTAHIKRFPEGDFFHSARRFIDDVGRPVSSVHPSQRRVAVDDFFESSPVKHLLCWRTEKGLSVGGMDESLNSVGPDDFDFPWTMAEHGAVFVAIPDCLYVARDHRAYYRLTTHLPRSTHLRELHRIMRKHGASRRVTWRRLNRARRSYLRQCLYATPFDRWIKQRLGADVGRGRREPYA